MSNLVFFLRLVNLAIYFGVVNFLYRNNAQKKWDQFRKILQNLGPTFIKLGQTLSSRPDLIGAIPAKELSILQDRLPSFHFNIVKEIIKQELGGSIEDIFSYFEENPKAAASVAQVHKAITITGEVVAVKILRPNVEKLFKKDINFLLWVAHFIENNFKKAKRLKPVEVVKFLKKTVKFELDLKLEAAAASEFREYNLKRNLVYIPKVFWNLTTHRVFTSEWIEGISIAQKDLLIKEKYDLDKICKNLAVSFFCQAYQDGFFHADLHPGNIIVTSEGNLALIDFGIMGRLEHNTRLHIAEILHSFLKRDYKRVAEIHFEAGYIPQHQSLKLFTQACRSIGEPIVGLPTNQISVGKLLTQLFRITADFEMETQIDLIMLQKTTILIEGIGMQLNPSLNLWRLAEPWIEDWAIANISPEAKISYTIKNFIKKIPKSINSIDSSSASIIKHIPSQSYIPWKIIILTSIITSIFTYYIIKLGL